MFTIIIYQEWVKAREREVRKHLFFYVTNKGYNYF